MKYFYFSRLPGFEYIFVTYYQILQILAYIYNWFSRVLLMTAANVTEPEGTCYTGKLQIVQGSISLGAK